jgi:hypothetical protein
MFADMYGELQGNVVGVDAAYAQTLIKEAWEDVRRLGGWSFQFGETGFTVPGALSNGTVTLQFGSDQVIGDALASTAWLTASQYGSLLTQRQFRSGGVSGAGTMYDIIAYNPAGSPPFATLTLNRPFTDPLTVMTAPVAVQKYMVYQPYIVAPVKGFRRWLSVFDIANSGWLFTRGDRRETGLADPQRQIFSNPDRLLALGTDTRANSSTAGWQRYELWPGPQSQYLYQAWYLHFGPDLVNPSDELPAGISESMVKSRARYRCYEQAEANKDPQNPRGSGADYRFLMGAADKQFSAELKLARLEDRDKCDIFLSTMHRFRGGPAPVTYNPSTGGIMAQVGV